MIATVLLALGGLALAGVLARVAITVDGRGRARALAPASRELPPRLRGAIASRLARTELEVAPEAALRWWAGAVLAAAWSMLVVAPPLLVPGVLAAAAAGPFSLVLLAGRADRAARAALPGVLDHVVAQLRAGGTVPDALRALAQRDGPLRHDFRRVTARLDLGATVEESLHGWAEERPVPGVRAAAGALTMVLALGGAAASPLEGLAVSLRNDEAAAGEARALSAQARVSAMVVGLAPLVYLAFSTMTDPASARVLLGSFLGRVCLVTGLGLEVLAVVWMRALVKEPE